MHHHVCTCACSLWTVPWQWHAREMSEWLLCRQKNMSMTWMTWMTWTKFVNQFSFSPKHVTPSCFGPNLGRNQPNIWLQRQVWALQVAALHNLGKDAPVSDSIMATCDMKPLFFKLHLVTSDSIGPTNLTAASMEPDVQRNANVSPKIHIYKNDILRGIGMTWQLVTRNCGWNGGHVHEASPTTGHQQHILGNGKCMV